MGYRFFFAPYRKSNSETLTVMSNNKDQKDRKNKHAYLRDFQPDDSGAYIYTGVRMSPMPPGGKSVRRMYLEMTALSCAAVLFCVIGGCIPSAGMLNCFYVILPFIAEISLAVSILWIMCRMTYHGYSGDALREYVYEATFAKIDGRTKTAQLLTAVSFAATIFYVIINGFDSNIPATLIYLFTKVNIFLHFFGIRKLARAVTWKKMTHSLMNE